MKSIILTGFMGTGKTVVGKLLAKRVGWRFLDLDSVIEQQASITVPEIFDRFGEARFREMEAEAVKTVSQESELILATGGGAMMRRENADLLRLMGLVILLKADPRTILRRVSFGERRPLLEGVDDPLTHVRQMLRQRKPSYQLADYSIDTSHLTPEVVTQKVEQLYKAWQSEEVVEVRLFRDSYNIFIKEGILRQAGHRLESLGLKGKLLLVSDRNVAKHYASLVSKSLAHSGFEVASYLLPTGERAKSMTQAKKMLDEMAGREMPRDSTVLALGGGVVGDAAGFAASIYMRGINLVQIPTSLLAQVDSSVGGKVAVNHPEAKNLIGSFYQPRSVLIDPLALRTLPLRELKAGLAEVIKSAIIADEDFFSYLEAHTEAILRRDARALAHIVKRCCEIKAEVVSQDERETLGLREVLNYGHSFAHAIEAASHYARLKHGEAVAIGMVAAGKLSEELGLASPETTARQKQLISRLGLPTKAPALSAPQIVPALALDKKARTSGLRFVLIDGRLGRVKIVSNPPLPAVERAIEAITENAPPSGTLA